MKTLERRLGLGSVIGISVGAMLGSGLFVLPGLAAAKTGASVWLAYLVAGLCVLPAALSKSELATAMPVAGGTYYYVDRSFGPLISTITGLGLWLALLLKSAFALVGFGAYLSVFTDAPVVPIGLALLVLIVGLNVVGVRKVGKAQAWVVTVSVIALVLAFGLSLVTADLRLLENPFSHGAVGFVNTVSFVYISYAGVTKVAAIAEEVEDPNRNLPLGILLSLGGVSILYVGVTFGLVANVPLDQLAGDLRPIHTMVKEIAGAELGIVAAVIGVVTMVSMANAGLLASSRFPFAMGRDDLLPRALAKVSARFMTPVVSIIVTGAVMGIAIVFLDVAGIAKLASALTIAAFVIVNFAVIVLRETGVQWYKPTFRSPAYPFVQIIGIVLGAGLLVALGWKSAIAIGGVTVIGLVTFMVYGRNLSERRDVFGRLGPRPDQLMPETQSTDLEQPLPSEAVVVVPLLGPERSPENLVEVASVLADGGNVDVLHLTEVPEQLMLAGFGADNVQVDSAIRRVRAFADELHQDISVQKHMTRDVVRSIHEVSRLVSCQWLLMEWRGQADRRILSSTPLGWLIDHLECNLALFKDAGVRTVREILVLTEPGPHDALVAGTADHLAAVHRAKLTFVRFVEETAPADVEEGELAYLEQLRKLCEAESAATVVRGRHMVRTVAALTSGFDLLVTGAPRDPRLSDYLRPSPVEQLTRAAACSVLRLKAPRQQTHQALAPKRGRSRPKVRVFDFITDECWGARVAPLQKDALLAYFSSKFAEVVPNVKAKTIEEGLLERERTQNTAVGHGLAFPHATVPEADSAYLGVFTTATAIDYKAPDGGAVDVFFVTIGPPGERNTHVRILAALSDLVVRTSLLEDLRAAGDAEALQAALLNASRRRADVSGPDQGRPSTAPHSQDLPLPPSVEEPTS